MANCVLTESLNYSNSMVLNISVNSEMDLDGSILQEPVNENNINLFNSTITPPNK